MANESDKKAKLRESLSRASKIMQLESNGTLDKIAASNRDGINSSLDGGVSTSELISTAPNRASRPVTATRKPGSNASNVPLAIREAFMKNPIDDSALYSAFGDNGDGRSLSFLSEEGGNKVREIVSEGMASETRQTVQHPSSQGIDYPMIRTIVEDIVRKYAVSLNKKIISEGKQQFNEIGTIALGKTFKFLDNEGNIYECTMKKVGNVKSKKLNG